MARYVEDRNGVTLFVDGSLDTLLPVNSVARSIAAALDTLDFSAFEASYRNDAMGRLALDPRRLAGVWILSTLRGVTSSVALAEGCSRDIELRWLMGDAPVQKSTLCDFRKNHTEALADLSAKLLAALARSGQLPGEDLVVDGTIIRAAASCGANVRRKDLKKRVKKLKAVIEEKLAASDGEEEAAEAAALDGRVKRLEACLAEMDRLELDQDNDRVTITEPEASKKKLKTTGGFAPAHNVQVVSDAQSGAMVSVDVVPQGNDQGQLGPQCGRVLDVLERVAALEPEAGPVQVKTISADGAYHDTKQLHAMLEQGIQPVVSDNPSTQPTSKAEAGYWAADFTYDADNNTMRCPQGQRLYSYGLNEGKTAARYRAKARVCAQCPAKAKCCPGGKSGRTVNRPLYTATLDAVASFVESPEGQERLRARGVTSEGNFSRMIQLLHWKRCRTWGAAGAKAEALWRQITHNLLLLIGYWQPMVRKPEPTARTI